MTTDSLSKTLEPLAEKYQMLSTREKQLIWSMLAAGLLIGLYYLATTITPLFVEQQAQLIKLEKQVDALPKLVSRWSALSATKKSIESTFDSSDTGIGTRSYLEDLIKTKVGISDLKSIRALQPRAFGQDEKFENTIYTVNFFTTELKQVVDFLEGVTKGVQPLILSKITLKKTGTKLNVQVELSSISQKASV